MKKEIELYEILYLLNHYYTQQEIKTKVDYYQTFLTSQGSQVMVQNRGKRALSYPIKGFENANYIQMLYLGNGKLVATLNKEQLGKPLNHQNATNQLRAMRGKKVTFHSALCLYNAESGNIQAEVVPYVVKFRKLTDEQIESYLVKEQPYHCAGSAKSEGLGIALMESMVGEDPNALIGLPLIKLVTMLQKEGVNII